MGLKCNLQTSANEGGFYFTINRDLGHWTQASCSILCLSRQRLSALLCSSTIILQFFIPLPGNLYLPSCDIRKSFISLHRSHHSHAATNSKLFTPPKCTAIYCSNHAGRSFSQRPLLPVHTTQSTGVQKTLEHRLWEQTIKSNNPASPQPGQNVNSNISALRQDFNKAQMQTIPQLIQDTIHPAGRTPKKQLRPP